MTKTPESVESSPVNEGILTRSRFRNKTLANQAIFLFSISTTFITPPNYYMWLHVIAFLVHINVFNRNEWMVVTSCHTLQCESSFICNKKDIGYQRTTNMTYTLVLVAMFYHVKICSFAMRRTSAIKGQPM